MKKWQISKRNQCLTKNQQTGSNNGLLELGKRTKALPNLPIFINKKDLFID